MPAIVVAGGVYDDNDREIVVDYREFGSDEDAWTNWTTASRNTTRFEIAPLKSAQAYYVSIQHRNGFGALSKRLILGPHTAADLKIDASKIDFLSQIGEASLAAWAENVNETVEAAAGAAAEAATVIADVNLLSETSIEQSLRDVYLKDYVEELAYLEGQTATASSISTLTATTGSHTSSISLLNSASSSYGTKTVLSTNVNGHVAGTALLNGGAGASSFIVVADKFVVASTSGGVAQAPFAVSGSTVYMDNVVARNIGAGTISADQIIGGAVSTITTTSSAPSLLLSTGAQAVLSWSHANAGGKMVINVSCRCSNSSGGKAGVRAVLYRNGSYVDEDTFMVDASFTNSGAFTFFDQPGSGTHTYSVQLNLTSGSGTPVYSVANRAIATELKR